MPQRRVLFGVTSLLVVAGAVALFSVDAPPAPARHVTIVVAEQPHNLDACETATSNVSRIVSQNVNESLTQLDPATAQVRPRLAISWESDDDRVWRFKLREGVTFHDGRPFDAEAAVYSIRRLMSRSLSCSVRYKTFGGVGVEAKALDAHTLEIRTDVPTPIFPTLAAAIKVVSPATPADRITREPIGTGPYRFVRWVAGQRVELQRFDGYWGEPPQIESATYVWRPESLMRAAMVLTGEADLSPYLAAQDADQPTLDIPYLNPETTRMRIDATQAPLDDVRVRLAMNLAIDRDALRTALFGADAQPAAQLVVAGVFGYNPELAAWPYDPERARALLAEAAASGVPIDRTITIIARPNIYPNASEVAEALMAMWHDVGLRVVIRNFEIADWLRYLKRPYPTDMGPNVLQDQHDNGQGDAVFTLFSKYHSEGANSKIADERIDQLIEDGRVATGQQRQDAFREVFREAHERLVADVMLFHMTSYARVSPRLRWRPDVRTNNEIEIADIGLRP